MENIRKATIHLMHGFIGFGKTTVAKELEVKIPAVRLTHDEFMVKLYGRNMPYADFSANYKRVDDLILEMAEKIIKAGADVIMDYGFWSHEDRKNAYERAKKIADNVVFHKISCDINVAKERVLERTANNPDALYISNEEFDTLLKRYEEWDGQDDYPVVLHNAPTSQYIGKMVKVKIDRPMGSKHPKHDFIYPVNYGYIPYTKSGDGEELDAYVLGVNSPLKEYEGQCIAVIKRINDNDDKLIVVPKALDLSDEEIEKEVCFQEKWFKHVLVRKPS